LTTEVKIADGVTHHLVEVSGQSGETEGGANELEMAFFGVDAGYGECCEGPTFGGETKLVEALMEVCYGGKPFAVGVCDTSPGCVFLDRKCVSATGCDLVKAHIESRGVGHIDCSEAAIDCLVVHTAPPAKFGDVARHGSAFGVSRGC
jgi:hypothetical protein